MSEAAAVNQEELDNLNKEVINLNSTDGVQLIVQMRIYDVLMALLTDTNPEAAGRLMEIHGEGKIMGFSPEFNGHFVANGFVNP